MDKIKQWWNNPENWKPEKIDKNTILQLITIYLLFLLLTKKY